MHQIFSHIPICMGEHLLGALLFNMNCKKSLFLYLYVRSDIDWCFRSLISLCFRVLMLNINKKIQIMNFLLVPTKIKIPYCFIKWFDTKESLNIPFVSVNLYLFLMKMHAYMYNPLLHIGKKGTCTCILDRNTIKLLQNMQCYIRYTCICFAMVRKIIVWYGV